MVFEIKDEIIKVVFEKSKSKKISIEILFNSSIKIKANINLKEKEILLILNNHEKWIYENIKKIKTKNDFLLIRSYNEGDKFLFQGQKLDLKLIETPLNLATNIEKEKLIVYIDNKNHKEKIKLKIYNFYKNQALSILQDRVIHFQKYFQHKPKQITIKNQKRRWGSCTYDNKLLFNWKIIMAPKEIIDYLVVHEMCHMEHKNHSKDFWSEVESILNDYKSSKLWLKENGISLEL
ncbi:MAG: M48 family metallopeptidase [Sarcina sp.]